MGRHTKYDPEYHPAKARELAEALYMDKEIADLFGINEVTFYRWQNRYSKFRKAVQEGKQKPNKEFEAAYAGLAKPHKLRKVIAEPVYDKDGKPVLGDDRKPKTRVVRIEEQEVDPNERAGRFLLTNRMRGKYQDRKALDLPPADPEEDVPFDQDAEAQIAIFIRGGGHNGNGNGSRASTKDATE